MSSFLIKVQGREEITGANHESRSIEKSALISSLIRALAQTVGNKRYLHDLENLLNKLELTPHDEETIWYLIRDLKN
jgi:hypothetical protein